MTYSEAQQLLASCSTQHEREAMAIKLIHASIEPEHTHTSKLAYESGPSLTYEQLSKIYKGIKRR